MTGFIIVIKNKQDAVIFMPFSVFSTDPISKCHFGW